MTDRRAEHRSLCADIVSLEWISEDGARNSEFVILEDISHEGACVHSEKPIPVAMQVMMTLGPTVFYGAVTHTQQTGNGYIAGLRFSETTRWRPDQTRPAHILNLACDRESGWSRR